MKRITVWLFLLLLTVPAWASRVVIYDQSNDRVEQYIPSANTPEYVGRPDALIEPDGLADLLAAQIPRRDWMRDLETVREMSVQEKADRDAEEAAAADAAMRAAAVASFDGQTSVGQRQRIVAEIMRREINILRALHSLPDRTLAQLKTQIADGINNGDVDE